MYQLKCSDGFEIHVIGMGNNGLCNVVDRNGKQVLSAGYDDVKQWMNSRGISELTTTHRAIYGDLMDYTTGDYIRPATAEEKAASDAEVAAGHNEGLITVDGKTCYVDA